MKPQDFRDAIVELCITLSRRGHLAGTGGNVAWRVDEKHLAVTPSATDYLSMRPSDICVLRLDDLSQVEGTKTPSVETGLHARVLRLRPDVACSIHTHQPVASACALMGQPLSVPAGAMRESLGTHVPVVGYAPSGTGWLASRLARAVRPDLQAYLMLNHGVLCCGPSMQAAVHAVECLEQLAQAHLQQRMAQRMVIQPHLQAALQRVTGALGSASDLPS